MTKDHSAGLIGQTIPTGAATEPRLSIPVSANEMDWVEHAAFAREFGQFGQVVSR